MERYLLHTPFSIYHFEASVWAHKVHNHTYFEIIFILKGSGVHSVNNNDLDYKAGDIFLLGPDDFHFFKIREMTEFSFVRFNEPFSKALGTNDESEWVPIIETYLYAVNRGGGSLVYDPQEKSKLFNLLTILEWEYENNKSPYYDMVRDGIMRSILLILARNLRKSDSVSEVPEYTDSVEAMLMYIKKNIYYPSRLGVEHLAKRFHIAPTYISILFKNQVGESLKQYVVKYRVKLIESRLALSQLTLSEIADEFGYTDESHFSKQFKKYNGLSPSEFRKEVKKKQ